MVIRYQIVLLLFFIFLIPAFLVVFCIHHDEHFQLIEFANYKRGIVDAKFLPWEFAARLRPTLQASLTFVILNFLESIGLLDPFKQSFVLRVMSAALFVFCSFRLYMALEVEIMGGFFKVFFFFFTFFLYIFPLTGVRFSSENWSACFFILAFAILYPFSKNPSKSGLTFGITFGAGVLFGLSFLFRYQAAIMIFGLGLWLLIFRIDKVRFWMVVFSGFILAAVFGVIVDRWFYGEWTFTALNYFTVNLLEGKAATFGVEPWWWYLSKIDQSKWMILLNGFLLILVAIFGVLNFRHAVSWVFFTFLIAHFLISHKETRFLYPIFGFIPFMVVSSLQFLFSMVRRPLIAYLALAPFFVIDCFAFVATCFTAPDNSIEIFKYIRELPYRPVVIYYDGIRFYYTLNDGSRDITPRFYKDKHEVIIRKRQADFIRNPGQYNITGDTLSFVILEWGEQERLNGRLKLVYDPEGSFTKLINYRNWMRLDASRWKVYSLNTNDPVRSAAPLDF